MTPQSPGAKPNGPARRVTVRNIGDLEEAERLVGLPVGPRGQRTKEKQEWYVLLKLLRQAVPDGVFELPADIRCGDANAVVPEPDFVVYREGTDNITALVEITEATSQEDQREFTLSQQSNKPASLLGEFGGRFSDGASHPEIIWASDILDAIKAKGGKTIFKSSTSRRHLVVYPNSNASILMFDEEDERAGIKLFREQFASEEASLRQMANGCAVHILCHYIDCFDALGDARIVARER